ncbi:MAG: hypothetical protein CMM93_06100 [Rickettsiales bacterium]|nr:hypothetical protein [Rickettsiales bacterium]|tara:strand:+ start:165 stop:827 length:663 start_codon:yes stop_codon:yes gene_type:complete
MKVVALSGWTQAPESLSQLFDAVTSIDYATHEPSHIPMPAECDLLIGWSLGGVLARQLLVSKQIKATALITLASPVQFVRSDQFYPAMPQDTFAQFYQNYASDTQRTLRRFAGLLSKGDSHADAVREGMQLHATAEQPEIWLPWLAHLEAQTHAEAHPQLPTLHIHGEEDAIVPVEQTEALPDWVTVERWAGCAHAPHFHDPARVRQSIQQFYNEVACRA